MPDVYFNCQHTCKNTCATLNEVLRKETAIIKYYEAALGECNIPEVKIFMDELVEDKRKIILRLIQKLNEIHVRSQALDGIASSFNNIDG